MIKVVNLCKEYKSNEHVTCSALKNINFTLPEKGMVFICGKSGSGKSTLLNVLSGNLKPDSGYVLLNGENICEMSAKRLAEIRRTSLGFVYQTLNLIATLNAEDNILLPLYLDRSDVKNARNKVREISEYLEISDLMKKFPSEMSGGERQRVAIARSLMHSPDVIMLDEPTGSLDSVNTLRVMELLKRINLEKGVTVIQVTHSEETAKYGNRTVILSDGEVVG